MNLKKLVSLAMVILILAFADLVTANANETSEPFTIVFDRDSLPADIEGLVAAADGELLFWFPEVGIAVAKGGNASFANAIAADASVLEVGLSGKWSVPETTLYTTLLDAPTPIDFLYYLHGWNIRRVGADQAWTNGVSGTHDTVVAVIDTGIDASHPDLEPNVVYQACMQLLGPCDDTHITYWHGTHVAGTVAASFAGGHVIGVGPNLGLAGYQVFEEFGTGAWDGPIWWAIFDAIDQGFEVINMSLGGYDLFPHTQGGGAAGWTAWNRVVRYATQQDVTIVASAGNGGVDINGPLYHIPGDLPGIINVSATGIQPDPFFPQPGYEDILAFYSNIGAAVDIAAPGGDCGVVDNCIDDPASGYPWYEYMVLSTFPDNSYAFAAGTSMATPHVAGAAGLVKDVNPSLNPHQVKAILTRTADKIGSRQSFGHGMLNVPAAVNVAGK